MECSRGQVALKLCASHRLADSCASADCLESTLQGGLPAAKQVGWQKAHRGWKHSLCDWAQALSNLVWACARVDHYDEALFDAAAGRVAHTWRQLCTVRAALLPPHPSTHALSRGWACSPCSIMPLLRVGA